MNGESFRGIVLKKVEEGKYLVKILREKGTCSSCAFSKFCSLGGKGEDEYIIEVHADGLTPGDEVVCEEKTSGIVFATALIFIVPIFAFVIGYYAGSFFGLSELVSVIVGFILMAIYFFFLHLFDKRLTDALLKFEVKRKG